MTKLFQAQMAPTGRVNEHLSLTEIASRGKLVSNLKSIASGLYVTCGSSFVDKAALLSIAIASKKLIKR